ncbi:hypothetical protein BASA81_009339 [Batrachochytrium salamandrivorans]|nr:hypothetical protein BASA62_004249 [Batrachochytrium salamandrivorans]KAH9252735.1 hypothetical protein BASA81_009339 [Batrachochytrium salamandrivorans]
MRRVLSGPTRPMSLPSQHLPSTKSTPSVSASATIPHLPHPQASSTPVKLSTDNIAPPQSALQTHPATMALPARVLYDYIASSSDEISISRDEIVSVLTEDDGSGWATVSRHGSKGVAPTSYIQILSSSEPNVSYTSSKSDRREVDDVKNGAMHTSASTPLASAPIPPPSRPPSVYGLAKSSTSHSLGTRSNGHTDSDIQSIGTPRFVNEAPSVHATVIFDYIKNSPDELTIYTGDYATVIESDDGSGWTLVREFAICGVILG